MTPDELRALRERLENAERHCRVNARLGMVTTSIQELQTIATLCRDALAALDALEQIEEDLREALVSMDLSNYDTAHAAVSHALAALRLARGGDE